MAKHQKPTKEELEEQMKASLEKVEKQEQDEKEEVEEIIKQHSEEADETEEAEELEEQDDVEDEEQEEVDEQEEADEEPEPSDPAPSPDYKEKFSQSSKEAQKLYAKNRKLNQALDEVDKIPVPTDEEMAEEYGSDWEEMTSIEQKLARENMFNRRFRDKLMNARAESRKIEKWNEQVEEFITNPETLIANPELEGKQEEFMRFAAEEKNNSVPFNLLVGAFLYEKASTKPKKKKGKMFSTGSGGPNKKDNRKPDKIPLDQAEKLRKVDYSQYVKLLKQGKIDLAVD